MQNCSKTLLTIIWGLSFLSCTEADHTNPLDTRSAALFIPQVSRPSGGEHWFPGTTQEIRWRPASEVIDITVSLQIICGGDTSFIAKDIPNNGHYQWQIPDRPSPSCRIRIIGRAGVSENPGPFRIRSTPILDRIPVGAEGGWEPTALRELVVFTSDRDGDEELYMLDRDTAQISRLTNRAGFDGEASFFKPFGKMFAYTSEDSTGKNVWMRVLEGPHAGAYQLTVDGGEQPAWQNVLETTALSKPAFTYKRRIPSNPFFSNLLAATLNTPLNAFPVLDLPLAFETPPTVIPLENGMTRDIIGAPAWIFLNGQNALIYDSGESVTHLTRADFPGQSYDQFIVNTPVGFLPGIYPMHPSISPDGEYIAFSSGGCIWISPINGIQALQMTRGVDTVDDYPDWSSPSEIVFQRKNLGSNHWEIWILQVQDLP